MARSSLEDFKIEGKLGSGSFGTVYQVTRKLDGRQYALKEIDLRCMSEQEQEDCIRECSVLAALDCPHIIKFYDSFLQKGKLYICMEYAAGGNLYDYIREQSVQLSEERIWQLFIQMLLGLSYMHGRKILHRDFKTANVFLDKQLNVRLGDLGVAKVLSDQTSNAKTMIGTPYYLSPEMCEDKPYNEKSDVWALGVGLYECCARRHPFDAENQGSLILKILRGKYPPVTGYSKELTDIVKSCLTLDASKRPGTKSLLALKAVREHAKQLDIELPPLPSKPPSPSPPPTSRPSRSSIAVSRVQSRRMTDPEAAAATEQPPAAGAPSRSPAPPIGRSPSSRMPAALAKVDLSAGLLMVGPTAAANKPPAAGRRRTATEELPGALSAADLGPVERQVQDIKLGPAAVAARRPSTEAVPAVSGLSAGPSPRPAAEEPCNCSGAVQHTDDSCRVSCSSSSDVTPPLTERRAGMQQALPAVKAKIIELVGPLAYDALRSSLMASAQAGDPLRVLQDGNSSSSSDSYATGQGNKQGLGEQPSLIAAMQRIVPESQVSAVLPLLVKLSYLEAQLGEGSSNAQTQDKEALVGGWDYCL